MIKKIVFNMPNDTITIYKIQFSTKIDGEWGIYDIGKYIGPTNGSNGIEFDNIIVQCDKFVSNTGVSVSTLQNPFLFNRSNAIVRAGTGRITVTFKEGLRVLSGIHYGTYSGAFAGVYVYDENDVLLYEGKGFKQMSASTADYAKDFHATPALEVMRVYPTNVVGTIETNDNTQVSSIYKIENMNLSQVTPDGTDIRYLLSFDGRNTYKTYKDGSWNVVDITDLSNIMSDGLTKDELESMTSDIFDLAITDDRTVDILIGMTTNNTYSTPSISEIKVLYLKIV